MHRKHYASRYECAVDFDQRFNVRTSLGGSMVVGSSMSDSIGFLGNQVNSEVEITSGIICFCLPVFPQLYRQRMKKLFFATNSRPTYSRSGLSTTPSPYSRHIDGLRGQWERSDVACGRFQPPKDHYVDIDIRTPSPGYFGSKRAVTRVYAPSRGPECGLENGQIGTITSVSVESHPAEDQGRFSQQ